MPNAETMRQPQELTEAAAIQPDQPGEQHDAVADMPSPPNITVGSEGALTSNSGFEATRITGTAIHRPYETSNRGDLRNSDGSLKVTYTEGGDANNDGYDQ